GEQLGVLQWNLCFLHDGPGFAPLARSRLAPKRFQPALPGPGEPGPWRKFIVEVTSAKVRVSWAAAPDRPPELVGELTVGQLHEKLAAMQAAHPELQNIPLRYVPRAPVGIYTSNSTASLRRAVLEVIEDR